MKIGLVLDDSLDKSDGVQQYVLTIGQWLSSQGHTVHYLVGQTKRTDVPNIHSLSRNVSVRFNQNRMSMPLPAARSKIRALLRTEKYDVLHVQMPYSPLMAGRLIAAAPPSTRVVGTFHILPFGRLQSVGARALGLYARPTLKRFDAICSVSEPARVFAKQAFGIDSVVIPNAVHVSTFSKGKRLPQYQELTTILFLGRLVERKGCQYLLHAIQKLASDGVLGQGSVRVLIGGRGPLLPQLEQYVKEHALENYVEFLGFVDEEEKANFLASADIAVFPSTGGESFGIVLVEAMAAGAGTVLGGDNPGYSSVLAEKPDQLFDPTDITAFSNILRLYLESSERRGASRDWQKKHVKQYDVPVVGASLLALYNAKGF